MKPHNSLLIKAFGKFQVEMNGFLVFEEFCRSEKAKELFRYLLLFKNMKISKEKLLDVFWPGMTLEKAYQNLNSTIYFIRNAFDRASEKGFGKSILRSSNQMLWLELPKDYYYDVEEFERFVDLAIHENSNRERIKYCKEALSVYKGDLFTEDTYSEWSISFREEYRELMINTLILLIEALYKEENFDECMYYIIKVLEIDKLNESAIYYKMLALSSKSLHNQALRTYKEYEELLYKEMGISPSSNLRELFYKITRQSDNNKIEHNLTIDIPNLLNIDDFKQILNLELKKRRKNSSLIEFQISNNSLIIKEKFLNHLISNLRESDLISIDGKKIYVLLVELNDLKKAPKILKRLVRGFDGDNILVKIVDTNSKIDILI